MPDAISHWGRLSVLCARSPKSALHFFKSPAPVPPDYTVDNLFAALRLTPFYRPMLKHFCSCLSVKSADKQYIEKNISFSDLESVFPGVDRRKFFTAEWICVPVPVVQGNTGKLVHLMVGLVRGKGRVCLLDRLGFDESVRNALETVLAVECLAAYTHGNDLLLWSLQPDEDPVVTGTSLSLPVALGIYCLLHRYSWPEGLYATGAIDESGRVLQVGSVEKKRLVINEMAGLFLVPDTNRIYYSVPETDLPVSDLEAACFGLECFVSGTLSSREIGLLRAVVDDPEVFFRHFDMLPSVALGMQWMRPMLDRFRGYPEKYLGDLSACLRHNLSDGARARVLAGLFSTEEITAVGRKDPVNAFSWANAMTAFYNYSGKVDESRRWRQTGKSIAEGVPSPYEHRRAVHDAVITERFNRYAFSFRLPAEFLNALAKRQKVWQEIEEDDPVLGAMYGTVAQNYGFCGPDFLPQLRDNVRKSLAAFGVTCKKEHVRLKAYLIYGLLDAGNHDEAVMMLNDYLSIRPGSGSADWLRVLSDMAEDRDTPYRIALVCRMLADYPDLIDHKNHALIARLFGRVLTGRGHPWQLTAVNLGRILLTLGETGLAGRLLKHSLHICDKNGETMQPMKLLPMSLCVAHDLETIGYEGQLFEVSRSIGDSPNLDQDHFRNLLLCRSGREVLVTVQREKNRLFPFSYR